MHAEVTRVWTCECCWYDIENEELRFCGKCGAPRDAEKPAPTAAPRPAAKRALPPPPAGYFVFRKMISPLVIRLLNVLGLLVFTGGGGYYLYLAYQESFANPGTLTAGLVLLILGNLLWRIACEILILFFSMHEVLVSIETRLAVHE